MRKESDLSKFGPVNLVYIYVTKRRKEKEKVFITSDELKNVLPETLDNV